MNFSQHRLSLLGSLRGFTLVELLVAAATAGIIVAALGFGLVTLMGIDRRSQVDASRQMDIGRAISFISNDIRESEFIGLPDSGYTVSGTCPGTTVLYLRNDRDAANANGVYYFRDISSCGSSVWVKPGLIMRTSRTTPIGDPPQNITALMGSEIMDALQAPFPSDQYSSLTAFQSSFCPAGAGTFTGTGGFYACIVNARTVRIYLSSRGVNNNVIEQSVTASARGR